MTKKKILCTIVSVLLLGTSVCSVFATDTSENFGTSDEIAVLENMEQVSTPVDFNFKVVSAGQNSVTVEFVSKSKIFDPPYVSEKGNKNAVEKVSTFQYSLEYDKEYNFVYTIFEDGVETVYNSFLRVERGDGVKVVFGDIIKNELSDEPKRAAGTRYESESNDTLATADITYDDYDNKDDNENTLSAQILVYDCSDSVNARVLKISDGSLALSEEVVYSFAEDKWSLDTVAPTYFNGTTLILNAEPSESSVIDNHISASNEIYFDKYKLQIEDDTWTILSENNKLFNADPTYKGVGHTPVSFFVNEEGYYVLCMTSVPLPESEVVCLRLTEDGEIDQYIVYNDWGVVGIDKAMMNKYNTFSSAKGFAYNEGRKLIYIDPNQNVIKELISETDIQSDIPELDTYRKFHNFFGDCVLMEDVYAVSFPAFNSLPGTYILYYTYENNLETYLLVEENAVKLFRNGKQVDSVDGTFLSVATIVD